jgi:uroporphyrin-III C-methyltransferase/precorrin-2 dehydrogenase/sirohydrochlorin ferrochelatase
VAFSYAAFLDVEGRRCVVVGGGRAGTEKARGLVAAGARVHVIDQAPSEELQDLAARGMLELHHRPYSSGDLKGAFVAVCTTGDPVVDGEVRREARARGVLVNSATQPEDGDFVVPGTVRRGDLTLAVSTGGRSPSLAKLLRERLELEFGPEWADVVDLVAQMRSASKKLIPTERLRRWRAALGSETLALLRDGRKEQAAARLRNVLSGAPRGLVSLVGAGPGDPGLITVAGKDRLGRADVILHDRLAHPALLDLAPADCERVYIGKSYGRHTLDQEELSNLLTFLAGQGKRVVRLKGGDPFVFGRGGEEASALARAGVPFEIVPGITSAVAVPAYAGVPVTDRRFGSSVAVVTGHRHPHDAECPVDWAGLATAVDTIVVLMGIRQLSAIVDALVAAGRPANTPAAAIEWGTYEGQRVIVCDLEDLPERARSERFGAPAVIVVGDVVSLHASLSWNGTQTCTLSREISEAARELSVSAEALVSSNEGER